MVSKNQHKGFLFDDTPRGILEATLMAGGFAVAMSTVPTLFLTLAAIGFVVSADDRVRRKKLQGSFQYALRRGYVRKTIDKNTLRIELTSRGRVRARALQDRRILSQPIARPNSWDGTWRLILFDIPSGKRAKRNAFRWFVRESGAVMLQKSVWIFPFDCSERVELLRRAFDFSEDELRLISTRSIGNDARLRARFHLT